MLVGKKGITVYPWRCTCGQELLFEEKDFEDRCIFEDTPNQTLLLYIKTPCPVCGRLWSNLSKGDLYPRRIEL